MREIKFRCWDVDRKAWLDETNTYQQLVNQVRWSPELHEYYPLMQYTGLKDKNGKEIYEGDIVRSLDWVYNNIIQDVDLEIYFWNGTFSAKT